MVNLPKPSAFASSVRDAALSRADPALHIPPPPPEPCCYRFGLTTLPQHADSELHISVQGFLIRLFSLAQLLSIPSLFGQGDGQAWTLSEQHYPALLQWKQRHVPALLSRVAELLQLLYTSNTTQNITKDDHALVELVVGHVTCAVARYLPLKATCPVSDLETGSGIALEAPQDDGWTSEMAQAKAEEILGGLRQQLSHCPIPDSSRVARALLIDYIKPILREAVASSSISTSSVDPNTGRKKPPAAGSAWIQYLDAHLGQHRFQSAADDNDGANLAPRRFALSLSPNSLLRTAVGDSVYSELGETWVQDLVERNEALGCINVLGWCLDSLQLGSESEWGSIWPLVVPPLMTLLEHVQPRFRLRGAILVHRLLLRPSCGVDGAESRRREVVLGKMLIRTGIGSLLERALHVNLTYVHDEEYAPWLVAHSIGAMRRLILVTTYPISYLDATPLSSAPRSGSGLQETLDEPDDCGKRRMDGLVGLVSQGVLSTWSYLPLPPSSTRLGRELVKVTCNAYTTLATDLAAPLSHSPRHAEANKGIGAIARFLDVTLDWIFRSWLSTLDLHHPDQITTTLQVLHLANHLLFPHPPPSPPSAAVPHAEAVWARRWTNVILSSVAKCWIVALESPLRSSTAPAHIQVWNQLQENLAQLMQNLSLVDTSIVPRWNQLVALDPRLDVLLPKQ